MTSETRWYDVYTDCGRFVACAACRDHATDHCEHARATFTPESLADGSDGLGMGGGSTR